MPSLDVNAALTNPYTLTSISVIRRTEVVSTDGVGSTADVVIAPVLGVVYPEGGNKLDRRPEAQSVDKSCTVISQFRLHTAAETKQPDRIVWKGDTYECQSFEDYTNYGRGFTKVFCVAINPTQAAVE